MPRDPQGAGTRRSAMAQALLADAKSLEAYGQCGCFWHEDESGVTEYRCANCPIPPHAGEETKG